MKTKFVRLTLGLVFNCLVPAAVAQNVRVRYDPQSTIALGSTLNILNYNQALADCISYGADDLAFDNTGATKTAIKITVSSSYREMISDISKDFAIKSNGNLAVAGMSGDVDMDMSVKKTDYDKSAERSLLIGLTARSEYGREYIRRYSLKSPYKEYQQRKNWEALKVCGSHFVRANSRVAQVTVIISITDLDQSSKSTLTALFKNTSKGTFKVSEIGGSFGTTLTANLNSVVSLGQRLGTVSTDLIAIGGPGVQSAGAAIAVNDPSNVAAILASLSTIANGFTQANSSPEQMLLVPMTVFGIPAQAINYDRLNKVAKLRQHAADVEEQIRLIEEYRTRNPDLFSGYFVESLTKLQGVAAELNRRIGACAESSECSDVIEPPIAYLGDALTASELELSCTYRDVVRIDRSGKQVKQQLLDTLTVNLTGSLRFSEFLDLESAKVFRANLDRNMVSDRTSVAFNQPTLSDPDSQNRRRLFASVDYQDFGQLHVSSGADPSLANKLGEGRREFVSGTYFLEIPTRLWLPKITTTLGVPNASKCPVVRP